MVDRPGCGDKTLNQSGSLLCFPLFNLNPSFPEEQHPRLPRCARPDPF